MGRTIGNAISPRHTACSGDGTFTNTTEYEGATEGAAGFNYRDRMSVGEINIIKGNRTGIA